jgi:hypothetical protein
MTNSSHSLAGTVVQDFATVRRAVFNHDPVGLSSSRYGVFDVLALDGEDLCGRPWRACDWSRRKGL